MLENTIPGFLDDSGKQCASAAYCDQVSITARRWINGSPDGDATLIAELISPEEHTQNSFFLVRRRMNRVPAQDSFNLVAHASEDESYNGTVDSFRNTREA